MHLVKFTERWVAPFWPGPTSIVLSRSQAQVRCRPWVLLLSGVQTCSWEIDSQGAVIRWQVTVLKDCYCSNRAFNSDKEESWESFLACAMQSAHLMFFLAFLGKKTSRLRAQPREPDVTQFKPALLLSHLLHGPSSHYWKKIANFFRQPKRNQRQN